MVITAVQDPAERAEGRDVSHVQEVHKIAVLETSMMQKKYCERDFRLCKLS